MSKSDENVNATIMLLDDKDTIIRKFKRAVTDSEAEVRYGEDKPGISNLMDIYGCVTGKTYDEITAEFAGKGYGDFKLAVGEAVADELAPLQNRYEELLKEIKGRLEFSIFNLAYTCKEILNELPLERNKEILENIINLGMMDKYVKVTTNCNCKEKGRKLKNESI